MKMPRLRILLSAYQCAPGMGSVSQIGWEWYSRLSRVADVTLITHIRNRENLTRAGAPLEGTEVIYIDSEWFAGPLYRLASQLFPKSEHTVFLLSSADFYVYDHMALSKLRKHSGTWDLVHAVTPVSPLAATRLYRLGIPLIVGPWNGGLGSPSGFPEIMEQESSWIYRVRRVGVLLDRFFGCTKRAALVLSASMATDRSLPRHAHIQRMLENGVDLELFRPAATEGARSQSKVLQILFVGRLLPFKGVSLLLRAIARVTTEMRICLKVIGDGPLRGELEEEARQLGLAEIVSFAGVLPLAEIPAYMREADVFCLPSVRESGGAVLLEAEACGLPVIAVNYGGPGEIVDDEVGWLVSADGPENLIAGLVAAFRDIVQDPQRWTQRGQHGRIRAEQRYGWDARMVYAVSIYRAVLERQPVHA